MSSALNGSSTIQHFKGSDAIEIHDGITFDFYTGLPRMHSTCIPKPTESHQTLPSPCVIPKAIRAGGDWVWLVRQYVIMCCSCVTAYQLYINCVPCSGETMDMDVPTTSSSNPAPIVGHETSHDPEPEWMTRLRSVDTILGGEKTVALHQEFLIRNNHTDLQILKKTKVGVVSSGCGRWVWSVVGVVGGCGLVLFPDHMWYETVW